jgi:hypothetical protein
MMIVLGVLSGVLLFTVPLTAATQTGEQCTRDHGNRVRACPSGKTNYAAFNNCYKHSLAVFTACVNESKAAATRRIAERRAQVAEFLKTVGCSALPMGACELLDSENARNLMLTHRAVLTSKFCGTINFQAAKQLVQMGNAPRPAECRTLLELLEAR